MATSLKPSLNASIGMMETTQGFKELTSFKSDALQSTRIEKSE
ncbi:hypothetical protein COLO4_19980 [Corchorus olitorius]|uniref:Uncharacterized protein n=1 Tax=Corchorus olitorius TaxID=93759 RepID=A0A1R3J2G3_9ROSI|nr:hypothetical protein COLO4_19980 [Corchorus olitorius]